MDKVVASVDLANHAEVHAYFGTTYHHREIYPGLLPRHGPLPSQCGYFPGLAEIRSEEVVGPRCLLHTHTSSRSIIGEEYICSSLNWYHRVGWLMSTGTMTKENYFGPLV